MSEETVVDPGLSQLRDQTKNIMIPLLIKVFQLKSEATRLVDPPSRLCREEPKRSVQEVIAELTSLDKDLKLQQLWIESSRKQIEKILCEIHQDPLPSLASQIKANTPPHPAAQKSFRDTFAQKKAPSLKHSFSLRSLWKKLTGTL